jgi:aspartate/methionine/tyrosine aminotransferase
MWDRTITISSAGKTFSITGYKLGWLIGPDALIHPARMVQQYSIYSVATPMQKGIAKAIQYARKSDYFKTFAETLYTKSKVLVKTLQEVFGKENVFLPGAGYFVVVNIRDVKFPYENYSNMSRDFAFSKWFEKGDLVLHCD